MKLSLSQPKNFLTFILLIPSPIPLKGRLCVAQLPIGVNPQQSQISAQTSYPFYRLWVPYTVTTSDLESFQV